MFFDCMCSYFPNSATVLLLRKKTQDTLERVSFTILSSISTVSASELVRFSIVMQWATNVVRGIAQQHDESLWRHTRMCSFQILIGQKELRTLLRKFAENHRCEIWRLESLALWHPITGVMVNHICLFPNYAREAKARVITFICMTSLKKEF